MLAAVAAVTLVPQRAGAQSWLLKAQWRATCLDHADDAERAALGVQWAPAGTAADDAAMRALQRYVTGAGTSGDERLFRYLTLLGAYSYQASYSNDQELRRRLDAQLLLHARSGLAAQPNAALQVHLCMHARLIESLIEARDLENTNKLAAALAGLYRQVPASAAAADWPLVAALRAVATAPAGLDAALNALGAAAVTRAAGLEAVAPSRAGRLYAAAAPTPLLLNGNARQALQVAARASALAAEGERAAATWRAFPALYDAVKITQATEPPTTTALTEGIFATHGFPESSADRRANFEVLVRIAEVYRDLGRDNTEFWVLAYDELVALDNTSQESLPFLRGALARLAAATSRPVDALLHWRARAAPAPAAELVKARNLYEFLLESRRKSVIIDVRTQLLEAFIAESILYSLSRMPVATAAERAARDDLSFRVLQLDSFTRISVAAAAAGLKHADPSLTDVQRFQLERFYTYMGQHSTWVSGGAARVLVEPGGTLPSAEESWGAFTVMAIFQNETTSGLDQYYAVLARSAPQVAAMTVPFAVPLADFQGRLRSGQAVVGTVAGLHESYVWGITNERLAFERIDQTAGELGAAVEALRASVMARGTGGALEVPAFDAAAAFELYSATVGRVAAVLAGAEHVFWYGDGVLGAVPPAILVTAKPENPAPATRAELAQIEFFVDRYESSSLPDLYLGKTDFLKPARAAPRAATFAGIGAPLLSPEELAQETLSSSFELAGGTDVGDLRNLPKLPASRDELETLGAMFASTQLWLGDEATEARLKAAALTDYRVLAFATHGFTRSDIEGALYPSLLLAPPAEISGSDDGLLSTLEIGELTLDADLVLLSACNTATSDGRPDAEAFSGLAQSFLVAGARSLVVSHWPVASGAATRLSVGTVEGWLGGAPLAGSLRNAMQRLRADAESDLEAHPFFWGPFVLADDGASALAASR